jgi:hypothetical protein
MGRILIAARVAVAAEHREAYLDTLGRLARRLEARGQHVWLFVDRAAPGQYLEFTEGPDTAAHRWHGIADPDEAALEAELARLAHYDDSRRACWDEVPLPAH